MIALKGVIWKWARDGVVSILSRMAHQDFTVSYLSIGGGSRWCSSWHLVYFESRSLVVGFALLASAYSAITYYRAGDAQRAFLMAGMFVVGLLLFCLLRCCAALAQIRRGEPSAGRVIFEGALWLLWGAYFSYAWWRPISETLLLFEVVETVLVLLVLTTFHFNARPS